MASQFHTLITSVFLVVNLFRMSLIGMARLFTAGHHTLRYVAKLNGFSFVDVSTGLYGALYWRVLIVTIF